MNSIRLTALFFCFVSATFAADQIYRDEQNKIPIPVAVACTTAPVLNLREFLCELFENGGEDHPFITHNEAKWIMTAADYYALGSHQVEGFPLNWGQLSDEITVEPREVNYTFVDDTWKITAKYTATGACKNFRMCDAERLIPFSLPIVLVHTFIPENGITICS